MRKLLAVLLLLSASTSLKAQVEISQRKEGPPTYEDIYQYEEIFNYEVKYGMLKAAWIQVRAIRDTLYNGQERQVIQTFVRSNHRLPFVGKERDRFTSIIHKDSSGNMVTDYYWKDNLDEGIMKESEYDFDREMGVVRMLEEDGRRDTLDLVEPATAGQLVLLISRMHAGLDTTYKFPVFISTDLGYITATNTSEKKKRGSPAFDDKVYAYYSEGRADLDGPFGFRGKFKAWFLDDQLRTPLEAHLKVFIGNVRVRLTSYERKER